MKKLFASDYARWTRTVAQAMDMKGPPEKWGNTTGTYLNPGAIHLHGHELDDRITPREDQTALTKADEPPNDSHSANTAVTAADEDVDHLDGLPSLRSPIRFPPPLRPVPTKRIVVASTRNLRIGAGVAVVCATIAVGLSIYNLVRPGHTVVIRTTAPAVRGAAPTAVPAPAATDETSAPEPIIAPESPPVAGGETVKASAGEDRVAPAVAPVVPPSPVPSAGHVSEPSNGDPGARISATEKNDSKTRGGGRKHAKKGARSRGTHADKAAPTAPVAGVATPGEKPAEKTSAEKAATEKAPAEAVAADAKPGTGCSLRLGTLPWTEVWIDGQNTNAHTPYSEPITCGKHEVTVKRDDLGLAKTITISLREGETVKRSFVLQEDAPE